MIFSYSVPLLKNLSDQEFSKLGDVLEEVILNYVFHWCKNRFFFTASNVCFIYSRQNEDILKLH